MCRFLSLMHDGEWFSGDKTANINISYIYCIEYNSCLSCSKQSENGGTDKRENITCSSFKLQVNTVSSASMSQRQTTTQSGHTSIALHTFMSRDSLFCAILFSHPPPTMETRLKLWNLFWSIFSLYFSYTGVRHGPLRSQTAAADLNCCGVPVRSFFKVCVID